jgi:hypothetical protein
MIIGVTRADIRRRHAGDMRIDDIADVLASGIKESGSEKQNFLRWRRSPVSMDRIARWCDDPLRKRWGFKAAARAYHIARSGADVDIVGPYKDSAPSTIAVCFAHRVPGAPNESSNLFDISQNLAWLAKERRDIQEQLEWREQIPDLLKSLRSP